MARKWAKGKYTPIDNEELWNAENLQETNQEDTSCELASEFEREFSTTDNENIEENDDSTENILPGACMALVLNNGNTPRGWRQAITIPEWEKAMEREIYELESKQAWEVVPRPKNLSVLPGVWNFRIKKDENGKVIKYKARWCVDGFREGFLRPPENVFSPVAELSTIRMLIAIAAARKYTVLQSDFPNAYVNAEVGEDIYVTQPKGLESKDPYKYVCILKKALYGCAISGKRWNEVLSSVIVSLGYKGSFIDHCLFHREKNGNIEMMVIYVDDVLVISEGGEKGADQMLNELGRKFEIKKLGKATHILGFGIHQVPNGTFVEQSAYVKSILSENDLSNANVRNTPWDSHVKDDYQKLEGTEITSFRRALGQLAYLANGTRPDLSWAISRLASENNEPTKGGLGRIKRILRYLVGTVNLGIMYKNNNEIMDIRTYVDSSFSVDKVKGRSNTRYVTYLNGGPVIWRSRLQKTVADSPNTAEYIALHEAATASVGLYNMVNEIGIKVEKRCKLFEGNDGARRLAMHGMGQKKARHLSSKYHKVQELCEKGEVIILRVATEDQPTDLLTKGSHSCKQYSYLLEMLGVCQTRRK